MAQAEILIDVQHIIKITEHAVMARESMNLEARSNIMQWGNYDEKMLLKKHLIKRFEGLDGKPYRVIFLLENLKRGGRYFCWVLRVIEAHEVVAFIWKTIMMGSLKNIDATRYQDGWEFRATIEGEACGPN